MKNKEYYQDEIIKTFVRPYCNVCNFRKKNILKRKTCGAFTCAECNELTQEWLEQNYSPLDEKEKEYLSAVIKPWRDKVIAIKKAGSACEFIGINIADESPICFPYFKKGTMYKGMELNKEYSLEDLGI